MKIRSRKVTQQEIAKQLGLSITAVSRALKNCDDISKETKQIVLETAEQLGYQFKEKSATRDQPCIILFLPLDRPDKPIGETAAYFFASSVYDHAKNLNYRILTLPSGKSNNVAYIAEVVSLYKPAALIITDTVAQDPRVLYCLEKQITFITQGQTDIYTQHFCVDFNEFSWIHNAMAKFMAQGLTDPVLVLPNLELICVQHRLGTFQQQMMLYHLDFSEERNIFIWEDSTDIYELDYFLKKRGLCPNSVFLDSEYMLIQYYKLIEKKYGLSQLPKFACVTNVIDLAKILDYECDYYWQDFWDIGREVVNLMAYALTTPKEKWEIKQCLLPLILYEHRK